MVTLQCTVSLANLMREDSHRSELLTQCLLNDRAELIEDRGVWIHIRLAFNNTEGWVLKAQFEEIELNDFKTPFNFVLMPSVDIKQEHLAGTFSVKEEMNMNDFQAMNSIIRDEKTIRDIALSFLNSPYMWGGITKFGIDCSGLSQIVYRFFNIPLTSFAAEQFNEGKVLDFLQDARCGDIAFFDEEDGSITHVGILLSPTEIIHATEKAGRVVIDSIDQEGIISKRNGKRTHKLRIVKRID